MGGHDLTKGMPQEHDHRRGEPPRRMPSKPPARNSPPSLTTQVGGDHYKTSTIQPVEYIRANGLDFFEGSAVKYITRHRKKGGRQDLEKAIHYLQMILDFDYPEKEDANPDN